MVPKRCVESIPGEGVKLAGLKIGLGHGDGTSGHVYNDLGLGYARDVMYETREPRNTGREDANKIVFSFCKSRITLFILWDVIQYEINTSSILI